MMIEIMEEILHLMRMAKRKTKAVQSGQGAEGEVRTFLDAILQGTASPIPFEEIYSTSKVTFGVLESVRTGQAVRLG